MNSATLSHRPSSQEDAGPPQVFLVPLGGADAAQRRPWGPSQRGISLIFALITLVALSMAAVALIRSVDTGSTILGNLSFKQDALRSADQATGSAITWLTSNIANTNVMNGTTATTGYFATNQGTLDVLGGGKVTGPGNVARINWNNDACGTGFTGTCLTPFAEVSLDADLPTGAKTGVKAKYVIIRLCSAADPDAVTTQCARPANGSGSQGSERGEINQQTPQRLGAVTSSQYFRILVRTQGGRKAVAFTETLVHF